HLCDAGSAAPAPVGGPSNVAVDRYDTAGAATTPADAADPAREVILFTTSRTTRGPKLVMHSAATLAAHTRCVAASYGLREPDARLLAALPLCGVFGLNGALAALEAGAPIVMMDLFYAPRAARLLRE